MCERSSAGEHALHTGGVAGSIPAARTITPGKHVSLYSEEILPRILHLGMNLKAFRKLRQDVISKTHGTVLEVGFGSGLNLSFYPAAVTKVYAVEPSKRAWEIACKTARRLPFTVELAGERGEQIQLPDASVDCAVTTWTLCTIPNPELAIREILRVLKPGGRYIFLEHGRSDDSRVAMWQDRLTPWQRRLGGGCHLNRKIDLLLTDSGFVIERLNKFYMRGLRVAAFLYEGAAVKS
jgi:ubiquinone/menaquinone biosynthesis C-methylase UbiE